MRPKPDPELYLEPAGELDGLRLSLKPVPLLVFISLGAIILIASLLSIVALSRLDRRTEELLTRITERTTIAGRLRQAMMQMRVMEKNLVIDSSPERLETSIERLSVAEGEFRAGLRELALTGGDNAAEGAMVEAFRARFEEFRGELDRMIDLTRRDTLAKATELSRVRGRDLAEQCRLLLLTIIEQHRAAIALQARSEPARPDEIDQLTRTTAQARSALETLHDLQYFEQAVLSPLSDDDRIVLVQRLETLEAVFARAYQSLEQPDSATLADEHDRLGELFESWKANSAEVRRLAVEDSRSAATDLSFTAVRESYLKSAQSLDELLALSERSMQEIRQAHERAIEAGRGSILATGVLGLAIALGMVLMLVFQLASRYRRSVDAFSTESR